MTIDKQEVRRLYSSGLGSVVISRQLHIHPVYVRDICRDIIRTKEQAHRLKYPTISLKSYRIRARTLMTKLLGRKLQSYEHVHHIDHNPTNNAPDNLQIMSQEEHREEHKKHASPCLWLSKQKVEKKCPICLKKYTTSKYRNYIKTCSKLCGHILGGRVKHAKANRR